MIQIEHPCAADLPQLRELWKAAFGDTDSYLDVFFSTAFSPDRCMGIYAEGRIVSAAYWMDCSIGQHPAAYIYAVATNEAHRGQGLCRKLMDTIHSHLSAKGYCGSILVPGDPGLRRMYGKMGYADFGGIWECICASGPSAEALQRINKACFAQLRRNFLPENAVFQEGEGLALLDTLAEFYSGNQCLLTVAEGRILEFLGNPASLPAVVAGLGMAQAIVRMPGSDSFAMYRPLTQMDFPTYFAFAFD